MFADIITDVASNLDELRPSSLTELLLLLLKVIIRVLFKRAFKKILTRYAKKLTKALVEKAEGHRTKFLLEVVFDLIARFLIEALLNVLIY